MELNINSPFYFKNHYGIDDEVYKFCKRAYLFFKDKKYSDTLQIVGGNYKEKVKFFCNKNVAPIEIKMHFDDYYNADSIKRIELTKEMVLTAVKHIITKVDFDYDRFKEDLINLH